VRTRCLLGGLLLWITDPAAAQVASVQVDSSAGALEAIFPALPLSRNGCKYTAEAERLYEWSVSTTFTDSRYPNNHVFSLRFAFFWPDSLELSPLRFDSIAAANPVQVAELRGEPPMIGPGKLYRPDRARAERKNGVVTLSVSGHEAVDALLRTEASRVGLSWCEGPDQPSKFLAVPLKRKQESRRQ
jgi:hypothetical protein